MSRIRFSKHGMIKTFQNNHGKITRTMYTRITRKSLLKSHRDFYISNLPNHYFNSYTNSNHNKGYNLNINQLRKMYLDYIHSLEDIKKARIDCNSFPIVNQSHINLHVNPAECKSIRTNDIMTADYSHIGKEISDTTDYSESLKRLNVTLSRTYEKHAIYSLSDIASYNIHITLSAHCLKHLYSLGNTIAGNIANGRNDVNATIEDIANEIYIFMIEFSDNNSLFNMDTGELNITPEFIKGLYNTVNRYLYSHAQRHFKRLYTITDTGEYTTLDNIENIASQIDDISPILQRYDIHRFLVALNLKNHNIGNVFALRLQGYKVKEIADKLNISDRTIRNYEHEYRKLWESMFGRSNGSSYSYISNCEYHDI